MVSVLYGDASADEGRANGRRRTYLRGRVFCGADLSMWFDCTVRDLAPEGASLKLPTNHPAPEAFTLLLVGEGAAVDCRVRWRRGDSVGVSFEARHDLRQGVERRLRPVQAVWSTIR